MFFGGVAFRMPLQTLKLQEPSLGIAVGLPRPLLCSCFLLCVLAGSGLWSQHPRAVRRWGVPVAQDRAGQARAAWCSVASTVPAREGSLPARTPGCLLQQGPSSSLGDWGGAISRRHDVLGALQFLWPGTAESQLDVSFLGSLSDTLCLLGTLCVSRLCWFSLYFHLLSGGRGENLHSAGSLPMCPQQAGLGQVWCKLKPVSGSHRQQGSKP